MLLVNARMGPSQIHGFGSIAQEFIPVGTITWRFQPGFDLELTEEQVEALSPTARAQVRYYAFFDPARRLYFLCSDDDRFTNHSETPNQRMEGDVSIATRDIEAGEELTCDYRELGWTEFLGTPEAIIREEHGLQADERNAI